MQDHSSRRVYACLAFPYPNKSRQTTTTAACREGSAGRKIALGQGRWFAAQCLSTIADRKSTRLNSSDITISYAVFCLKKKKKIQQHTEATYTTNAIIHSH